MMDLMRTEEGRAALLRAADELGKARDAELAAGNTKVGMDLNTCALATYALAIRVED